MKTLKRVKSSPTRLLLACFVILTTSFARAAGENDGGGAGNTGGGRSVIVAGHPEMMDLVRNCRWISGNDFVTEFSPDTKSVLKKIHDVHWYFARSLAEEISNLQVCETEMNLRQINVTDKDSFTIFSSSVGDQIAIRDGNQVWIDIKLANQMLRRDRPSLILHEAMHAYLPYNAHRRNDYLRSMTAFLSGPINADSLALNISANGLHLDPSTKDFKFTENEFVQYKANSLSVKESLAVADKIRETGLAATVDGFFLWKNAYENYAQLLRAIESAFSSRSKDLKALVASTGAQASESLNTKYFYSSRTLTNIIFGSNGWGYRWTEESKCCQYDPSDKDNNTEVEPLPFNYALASFDVNWIKELLPERRKDMSSKDLAVTRFLALSDSARGHEKEIFEIFMILLSEPKIVNEMSLEDFGVLYFLARSPLSHGHEAELFARFKAILSAPRLGQMIKEGPDLNLKHVGERWGTPNNLIEKMDAYACKALGGSMWTCL